MWKSWTWTATELTIEIKTLSMLENFAIKVGSLKKKIGTLTWHELIDWPPDCTWKGVRKGQISFHKITRTLRRFKVIW